MRRPEQRGSDPEEDLAVRLVNSLDDLEQELIDVEFNGRVSVVQGSLGNVGGYHIEAGEHNDALVDGGDLLDS